MLLCVIFTLTATTEVWQSHHALVVWLLLVTRDIKIHIDESKEQPNGS